MKKLLFTLVSLPNLCLAVTPCVTQTDEAFAAPSCSSKAHNLFTHRLGCRHFAAELPADSGLTDPASRDRDAYMQKQYTSLNCSQSDIPALRALLASPKEDDASEAAIRSFLNLYGDDQ